MKIIYSELEREIIQLENSEEVIFTKSMICLDQKILLTHYEASMASDLSIHNMLLAGTAGVESKLSGTPTIFLMI